MPNQDWWIVFKTKKEGNAPKELAGDLKEVKAGLVGAIEGFTGMSLSGLGLAGVIAGVGAAMKESVDFTVNYAEQVRDLSRVTGASAEETSKLIQVSDDLKIDYGTLTQAAKALAKDGLALTTEALAKASDEYLAHKTAGERAQYATEKFGKAGLELTKILEQGGDAIRAMAAEQSGNLILTDETLQKTREYEKAQDGLNDTLDGFKVVAGTAVLPFMTGIVKGLTDMITQGERAKGVFTSVGASAVVGAVSVEEWIENMKKAGYVFDDVGNLVQRTAPGMASNYTQMADKVIMSTDEVIEKFEELKQAQVDAAIKKGFEDAEKAAKESAQAINADWERMRQEMARTDRAIAQELATSFDVLKFAVGGSVGEAYNQFIGKQDALKAKIAELEGEIGKLGKQKYLTVEQQGQLEELQGKLSGAKGDLTALADEFELSSKKMLFSMLTQKAAADGITQVEYENLVKIAQGWGIIDEKSAQTATALNKIDLNEGMVKLEDLDDLLAEIQGKLGDKWLNVHVKTDFSGDAPAGTGKNEAYASGGSFVIPPGYENETYPLGPGKTASSGETVTVTPKGKGGGLPAMNVYISDSMDLESFKRMLMQVAG